jgi:hypothetical protein
MDFDDLAARAGRSAVESGARATPPSIEDVRSLRRKRAAIGASLVGFVGTLLVVGSILVWPGTGPVTPDATDTTPTSTTTTVGPTTTTTTPTDVPFLLGTGAECEGIDNMPEGWRDEAFHVGPLWLWTIGSGRTATQTIAILDPGTEAVTLRVPIAWRDRVAHLFDSSRWNSGGYYRLEDGRTDVTFVPCGDGYQQFVGGFVYSGDPCVDLEFTIGDGDPAIESVPLLPGGCDAPPEMAIWRAAYPASWDRAGRELMPNLGWDSLTLATFDLRAGGSRCAHMPENALRDLGPAEALVSVFFAGDDAFPAAVPRPDRFDDTTFPAQDGTDAAGCAEREDLEIHWGAYAFDGRRSGAVYLLVVFGDEVTARTRTTTWDVVSSLRPPADENGGSICVVTAPPSPGFVPPEPFPATPLTTPTDGRGRRRRRRWGRRHRTHHRRRVHRGRRRPARTRLLGDRRPARGA